MTYEKFIRYVLIFEAVALNGGTGAMCLFAPNMFAAQFSPAALPSAGLEFIRWYGVLLWVLSFYVLRVLPANDEAALAPAVEALLFGDLVHLYAIYMFYRAFPFWTFSFAVMLFFTATLAALRSVWVYRRLRRESARQG